MPLSDFIERGETVHAGGRLIVCRPPTVATVFKFLEFYGAEAKALALAKRKGATLPDNLVEHAIDVFADLRFPGPVLETCCELIGGHPGSLSSALREDATLAPLLAKKVVGMCDQERIGEALQLDSEPMPEAVDVADEHYLDDVVVSMSQRFGITPQELVTWNYEAFLSAAAALGRTVVTATDHKQLDGDSFRSMGLAYEVPG